MGSDCILQRLAGGMHWIQLVQGRDRWWALVNTVKNVPTLVPRNCVSRKRPEQRGRSK
jgi:hypothetical protein